MFKDMNQNQSVFAKLDGFPLLCFFSHLYGSSLSKCRVFFPVSRTRGRGGKGIWKELP